MAQRKHGTATATRLPNGNYEVIIDLPRPIAIHVPELSKDEVAAPMHPHTTPDLVEAAGVKAWKMPEEMPDLAPNILSDITDALNAASAP